MRTHNDLLLYTNRYTFLKRNGFYHQICFLNSVGLEICTYEYEYSHRSESVILAKPTLFHIITFNWVNYHLQHTALRRVFAKKLTSGEI